MQTFDNLKNSIGSQTTVEGRVSSLITGYTALVEQNKNNPTALSEIAREANSSKSSLVQSVVHGSDKK